MLQQLIPQRQATADAPAISLAVNDISRNGRGDYFISVAAAYGSRDIAAADAEHLIEAATSNGTLKGHQPTDKYGWDKWTFAPDNTLLLLLPAAMQADIEDSARYQARQNQLPEYLFTAPRRSVVSGRYKGGAR